MNLVALCALILFRLPDRASVLCALSRFLKRDAFVRPISFREVHTHYKVLGSPKCENSLLRGIVVPMDMRNDGIAKIFRLYFSFLASPFYNCN